MSRTAVKLFAMSHGIPAKVSTPDAFKFYSTVARIHGFALVRSGWGYVIA